MNSPLEVCEPQPIILASDQLCRVWFGSCRFEVQLLLNLDFLLHQTKFAIELTDSLTFNFALKAAFEEICSEEQRWG